MAVMMTGCAQLSYDQLKLGQEHGEFKRAFPEAKVRRTPSGICYLEQDLLGRTDAVVVLLTTDRRIYGKLHASHLERESGFKANTSYELHGELDPVLAGLEGTGPIDALRVIADELTETDSDTLVREAHGWIAAGLVRLVQRWPHLGDAGPAFPRLTDMLEHVPAGGEASITVDREGTFLLHYSQGADR